MCLVGTWGLALLWPEAAHCHHLCVWGGRVGTVGTGMEGSLQARSARSTARLSAIQALGREGLCFQQLLPAASPSPELVTGCMSVAQPVLICLRVPGRVGGWAAGAVSSSSPPPIGHLAVLTCRPLVPVSQLTLSSSVSPARLSAVGMFCFVVLPRPASCLQLPHPLRLSLPPGICGVASCLPYSVCRGVALTSGQGKDMVLQALASGTWEPLWPAPPPSH